MVKMDIKELSEEYRRACKQKMMNDLVKEFNLLLFNENVSGDKINLTFQILMNTIKVSQMA